MSTEPVLLSAAANAVAVAVCLVIGLSAPVSAAIVAAVVALTALFARHQVTPETRAVERVQQAFGDGKATWEDPARVSYPVAPQVPASSGWDDVVA